MNLKQAFYKTYYKGIDFRKFRQNAHLSKSIEEKNARKFNTANNRLFDYAFQSKDSASLNLADYQLPNYAHFHLATTYPGLLTGIGMVHETNNQGELKLGFFFDHTSGLPMLPGSGVKGALRSAFPNFKASKANPLLPDLSIPEKKDKQAYLEKQKAKAKFIATLFAPYQQYLADESVLYNKVHQLELAIFAGVAIPTAVEKTTATEMLPMAKRCRFLEAIISQSGNKNSKIVGIDALTPHGDNPLKNPIPLPFLKVLPNVVFQFQFMLPPIMMEGQTFAGETIEALFEKILLHLGIGAKTNVGYGQFTNQMPKIETTNDAQKARWKPDIPWKARAVLKKGAKFEGKLVAIQEQYKKKYLYLEMTANGEVCQIRKVSGKGKVKDANGKKMEETAINALTENTPVTIVLMDDYDIVKDTFPFQIYLKN